MMARQNLSGNNSSAGVITLTADSRINLDSGTLTLAPSGNAVSGTYNLYLGGSGNVTVNSPIAISSGNLTKDGSGTLVLAANNAFTELTSITAGTVKLGANGDSTNTPPMEQLEVVQQFLVEQH